MIIVTGHMEIPAVFKGLFFDRGNPVGSTVSLVPDVIFGGLNRISVDYIGGAYK